MKLPELKIGNKIAKVPIVQGGMAIRLSTARLAAAVANEGGIGLIAASGMSHPELRYEIKLARSLTDGVIGINIMVAASDFVGIVKTAIDAGIDLIVAGAGFSRDIFGYGKESGTPIVPIVSSVKLAKISEKLGASAIVVEGKEAGGHLGTDSRGCKNSCNCGRRSFERQRHCRSFKDRRKWSSAWFAFCGKYRVERRAEFERILLEVKS